MWYRQYLDTMLCTDWHSDLAVSVLLGLPEEGSCLCLGRFCGWVHPQHVSRELGSCPLTLASPRTVLTVILTGEYWSSFEPLLCKLLGSLWNGFDSPERPLHGLQWWLTWEEKEVAVEWHLLCCPLHQPVMALLVCSVSPRRSSHGCSFLIILPQSLLAWQQPLHLSAVLWAEHNQTLVWWEVFLWVNFLGTWTMWYVCLFVKYEKGFLQDIELTF